MPDTTTNTRTWKKDIRPQPSTKVIWWFIAETPYRSRTLFTTERSEIRPKSFNNSIQKHCYRTRSCHYTSPWRIKGRHTNNYTASILDRAQIPPHRNISVEERKTLNSLKKDATRVVMKANMLKDNTTYNIVKKSLFKKAERELNAMLLFDLKNQQKLDEKTYSRLRSTNGIPPAIRGSIKYHKDGHPLRPIVTCIGSAFYDTSKFLSEILSPLLNHNGFSVSNSSQFAKEISNIAIEEDETMVSLIRRCVTVYCHPCR